MKKKVNEEALDAFSLYEKDMSGYSPPTKEEERDLGEKILAGGKEADRAREDLVCRNWKLALHVARQYVGCGLSLEDLLQEANLSMCKAAKSWDFNISSFSTYACTIMRRDIYRAICSNESIRLPEYLFRKRQKYNEYCSSFVETNGRLPDVEEVADYFGCDRAAAEALAGMRNVVNIPEGKYYDSDPSGIIYLLQTKSGVPQQKSLEEEAIPALTKEEIYEALSGGLSEKEARVFSEWAAGNSRTLAQLGASEGMSIEWARKLLMRAAKQIRENKDLLEALGY